MGGIVNVLKNVKGSFIKSKEVKIDYKCMNCGLPLENPDGPYARRFCSDACKEEYMDSLK